jgi:putative transposase
MARLPRSIFPDGMFHLVARGVDSCRIVRDDDDRRLWLALLAQAARRWAWHVYAFALMDTRYHVVAAARRDDLSDGMHHLNGRHAQLFNQRHTRTGHLFGDRFASFLIEGEDRLTTACRYVMENPVRAGLTEYVGDWPWAACRFQLED